MQPHDFCFGRTRLSPNSKQAALRRIFQVRGLHSLNLCHAFGSWKQAAAELEFFPGGYREAIWSCWPSIRAPKGEGPRASSEAIVRGGWLHEIPQFAMRWWAMRNPRSTQSGSLRNSWLVNSAMRELRANSMLLSFVRAQSGREKFAATWIPGLCHSSRRSP